MARSMRWVLALSSFISIASSGSDPAVAVTSTQYLHSARASIWRLDDQFAPQGGHAHPGIQNCLKGVHYCSDGFNLAAAHAMLGEATGNKSDFREAARLLGIYGQYWANATNAGRKPYQGQWDFFQCFPVVYTYRALLQFANRTRTTLPFNTTLQQWLKGAASDVCKPQMVGAFNQPLSRVTGTVVALQVWPELDANGTWTKYISAIWSGWIRQQAYTENSPVYNSIFLMNLLDLATLLHKSPKEYVTPELEQMLQKYRDLVGPAATLSAMPSFGDAWPDAGLPCLVHNCTVRTMWLEEDAPFWPAVFERAATLFNDGSFRTAAAAYFMLASTDSSAKPSSAKGAFWLLKAREWAVRGADGRGELSPAPRIIKTAMLNRREPVNAVVPDKLLLVGDSSGARPLMLQELYGDTMSHAHSMQKGGILYYTAQNHTFLKQQGRDNHMPEQAHILMSWEKPDGADGVHLPFRRPRDTMPSGGDYQTLELPTHHMSQPSLVPGPDFHLRTFNSLAFFLERTGIDAADQANVDSVYIADVALVARNGSVHAIADFGRPGELRNWEVALQKIPHSWHGPRHSNLSIDAAGGSNPAALRADVPGVGFASITLRRPVHSPGPCGGCRLDVREFPILTLKWRLAKDGVFTRRDFAPIFSVNTGPYPASQPYPNFGRQVSSNNDYNARQGIGAGAGYDQPARTNWSNAVIASPRFFPVVEAARTASRDDDHYGSANITGMHAAGSLWRRESLLLSEGPLVVVDTLVPAPRMHGWTAGPLWHLNIQQSPEECQCPAGAQTLCAVGQGFNMTDCKGGVTPGNLSLVLALASDGLAMGIEQGFLVGKLSPYSVYGRRSINGTARFLSVLLPFAPGSGDVVGMLNLKCTDDMLEPCEAQIPLPQGNIARVQIGNELSSGWAVSRSANIMV